MKLLVSKEDKNQPKRLQRGRRYFIRKIDQDFHCAEGIITAHDLDLPAGTRIVSSLGKQFVVLDPSTKDFYDKMERSAQIIPPKDVGAIILETGLSKQSTVIDAGSGSGGLSLTLARIARKVITYDIRDDHIDIVKKNIAFLKLKNISVKKGDFYEGVRERNADLVTLDLPEPWKGLDTAATVLKIGGYLVAYSPSIPQISDFVNAVRDDERFLFIKVIEVIEREWEIEGRKVRPISRSSIHSGFMAFARLITRTATIESTSPP